METAISQRDTQQWLLQLVKVLDYIHDQGMAHRDLKPENIFLTSAGAFTHVKVGDFGLAADVAGSTKVPKSMTKVGTTHYFSPELGENLKGSVRANDVWALGCIAAELVLHTRLDGAIWSGKPEMAARRAALFQRAQAADPVLGAAIPHMLAMEFRRRFTAGQVLRMLLRMLGSDEAAFAAASTQGVVVSPPAELQLNPAAAPAQDTLGVHDSLSVMVPDTLGIDGIAARLADSRSPRDLYDLLAELRAHTSASAQDFERFVRRNVPVLAQLHNAGGAGAVGDGATEDFSGLSRDGKVRVVAQLASQERQESAVWQSFLSSTSLRKERVLSWSNKPSGLDPLLTSLAGHSDSVSSIAISPDGKRVITGSSDHLVKIWEVETGALAWTSRTHDCKNGCTCTMPKNEYGNRCIRMTPGCPIKGHPGGVSCIALSSDGTRIASGSSNYLTRGWSDLMIWDCETGSEMFTMRPGSVTSVAFARDGKRLVSLVYQIFIIWNAETGAEVSRVGAKFKYSGSLSSVAFSPDGKRIVMGRTEDIFAEIWDVETSLAAKVCDLVGHTGSVSCIAFSPDGKLLVSGSEDTTVKIWDTSTGAELWTSRVHKDNKACTCRFSDLHCPIRGHSGMVLSVAFSPDGKRVVSGSYDKTVKIWNYETFGAAVPTLRGHSERVNSVAFTPDGKRVVSGSGDKLVKIWDVEAGTEVTTLSGHGAKVWSILFSPDGKRVISGSFDKLNVVWDVETGAEVCTLKELREHPIAFSPDGKRVVGTQGHGHVTEGRKAMATCDVETGEMVYNSEGSADVSSVAFSSDGKRVVSGAKNKLVKIWNADTGAQILVIGHTHKGNCSCTEGKRVDPECTVQGHSDCVVSVAFSPDGNRIVSGSYDRLVKIWNADTGAEVWTLTGHATSLHTVAFSPDGKLVVSWSTDHLIKIWDAVAGAQIHTLGHNSEGSCPCTPKHGDTRAQFTDDGSQIISCNRGNTVRFWDVASGEQVRQLAGEEFAIAEGPCDENKTGYVLIARGDLLLVYENAKEQQLEDSATAPVAFFVAPQRINSVRRYGAAICLGCERGAVCVLTAPFLAA